MIDFYAYRPNGQIVMTGYCPESQLEYQQVAGAEIAVGVADFRTQYRASDGTLQTIPPRPSEYHDFNYDTKSWAPNEEAASSGVRAERNRLLQESDWTDTASAPERLGQDAYQAWQTYRQELRDVTNQAGFPLSVAWPVPPQ